MKITIAGTGYVGLTMAVLLSQHHKVLALDIDAAKVALLNDRQSPIEDADISHYLAEKTLDLRATLVKHDAFAGADFVVFATPTDYDSQTNYFDTRTVEAVVRDVMPLKRPRWRLCPSSLPRLGCTRSTWCSTTLVARRKNKSSSSGGLFGNSARTSHQKAYNPAKRASTLPHASRKPVNYK